MKPNSDILLVEDNLQNAKLYEMYLKNEPIKLVHVDTGQNALKYLQSIIPQVILIDLGLPDMNGIEIVKYVKKNKLDCILIVITAEDSVEVDAMRNGVFDFIKKPFKAHRLIKTLHQVIKIHQSCRCFIPPKIQDFIGNSLSMQKVYQTIEKVAKSKASVFITGETGTGLAKDFLNKYSHIEQKQFIDFTPKARLILSDYKWPGNIRQLQNVIHSIVLLNEGKTVTPKMLRSKLDTELYYNSENSVKKKLVVEKIVKEDKSAFSTNIIENNTIRSFKDIEKEIIMRVIAICKGNIVKAADSLEISKSSIYNKLDKWNEEKGITNVDS